MHGPPAVEYPVGRSVFHAWGLLILLGLVLAADLAWLQAGLGGWRVALAGAAGLVAVMGAFLSWRQSARGLLRWNGESWLWESAGTSAAGDLVLRMDLQTCLLAEFVRSGTGKQWLWLERAQMPSRWLALRRAIHAAPVLSPDGHTPEPSSSPAAGGG